MDDQSTATGRAARALLELYGAQNAEFLARTFTAGWMTDAERRSFQPLAIALLDLADEAGEAA